VPSVDLRVDVTDAAGLGEPAHIALTVTAPEPDDLPPKPIVCFAKPGAGYSRGYFTVDLPGPPSRRRMTPTGMAGSQADWHAAAGWIVVSVDHLGVGESSQHDPDALTFSAVAAAAQAAEADVLQKLAAGTLIDGLGAVEHPVRIGIGQSMGGALTIIQQGRYHCYDGVAVLGYSPFRTLPPTAPGTPALALPWTPRAVLPSAGVFTNAPALAEAAARIGSGEFVPPANDEAGGGGEVAWSHPMAWGFHYDDVDPAVVRRDMDDYPARHGDMPAWGSAAIPGTVALWCVSPGSTLTEAAAIRCPVLLALGERDVVIDPLGDVRAYESALSVDLFVCPRMAHMHNFAGTRELFWQRIEVWADWVRAATESTGSGGGGSS